MGNAKRFLLAASLVLFTTASFADAGPIVLTAKGAKQGQFKGDPGDKSGNRMQASGFTFEVTSPRDAASGLATGKRSYKPLTITKPIGPSSPQFFQALVTNETLQTVTIEFVRTDGKSGGEAVYFAIKLTNASVASIRQQTPAPGAGGKDQTPMEEISFTFQRIDIESKDGKTVAVDDWQQVQ